MYGSMELGMEAPNPERDLLGLIQKQALSSPEAHYNEEQDARYIDQTRGNSEGVWLWVGLENEGGSMTHIQSDDGAEIEACQLANISIVNLQGTEYKYDARWLKVLLFGDEVKVHMHRLSVSARNNSEHSEYRFLNPHEVTSILAELQGCIEL